MSSLSRFTVKLFELIKKDENIKDIINYMKEIVLTNKIKFGIPIIIQNKVNKIINKKEQLLTDEMFYFINSPNLRKFNDKFIYMF